MSLLLRLLSTGTPVNATDSGVGSDASHIYHAASDSGVGSESTHHYYGATDSALGSETTRHYYAAAQSGAGSDASTLTIITLKSVVDGSTYTSLNPQSYWYRGRPSIIRVSRQNTGTEGFWYLGVPVAPIGFTTSPDASTLHVTLARTQSGSAADSSLLRPGTFNRTDSATAADTSSLHATYTVTQPGTGSDASTLAVHHNRTDSGTASDASHSYRAATEASSGSDASTEKVVLGRTDSSTGSDATQHYYAASDSGTSSDVATRTVVLARTDSGTASEVSTLRVALPRTESGAASDASTRQASLPNTDTGTASDASTERVALPRVESSTGSDASTEHATFPRTESGSGADTSTLVTRVLISVRDGNSYPATQNQSFWYRGKPRPRNSITNTTGQSFWYRGLPVGPLPVTVSGESSTLHASYSQTDSGSSSDVSSLRRTASDSATSTDTSTLHATFSVTDSGSATESSHVDIGGSHTSVSGSDSATGTEASTLQAAFGQDESGSTTDDGTIIHTGEDSGSASDSSSPPRVFLFPSETATGADISSLRVSLPETDSGHGVDAGPGRPQGEDSGHGTESHTLSVNLPRSDSGSATDKASFPVFGFDTGTIADLGAVLHANIGQRASTGNYVRNLASESFAALLIPSGGVFPETQTIHTSAAVAAGNKLWLVMVHNGDETTIDTISGGGLSWHILGALNDEAVLVVAYADAPSGLPINTAITIHYSNLCTRELYILDELTGLVPGGPKEFMIDPSGGGSNTPHTATSTVVAGINDLVTAAFMYRVSPDRSHWTPGPGYTLDEVQEGAVFVTGGPEGVTMHKNGTGVQVSASATVTGLPDFWAASLAIWAGVPSDVGADTGLGTDHGTSGEVPTPAPTPPTHGFIVLRGRMRIRAGVGVLNE